MANCLVTGKRADALARGYRRLGRRDRTPVTAVLLAHSLGILYLILDSGPLTGPQHFAGNMERRRLLCVCGSRARRFEAPGAAQGSCGAYVHPTARRPSWLSPAYAHETERGAAQVERQER